MGHSTADREEKIVSLFRQGDALAMDVLYADYAPYLTGVCARYISDDDTLKDVLQESFIKIFTQMGTFEYRGQGSLRAWMNRIVVNESLQSLRRQKRDQAMMLDTDPPDTADEEPNTAELSREEMGMLLRKLPDGYRAVLNLYVIEGWSHQEIARQLGIKPDSSASQLHRAKTMMARLIRNYKTNKL